MNDDAANSAPFAALGDQASREKRAVAMSSVLAAVVLTGTKLAVGLATGSLGILSEAAHSGLDLVAAAVTWAAVRVSGRPADREHTYGHGKIENLSALFEVALLFATCVWIVIEAIERLLFKVVHVEATPVAFAVMLGSILIDVSRSRALARVAKKYSSQALEADALHFSTDVWSSCVVLLGLGGVALSSRPGLLWLAKADAVAALGVAAIVVWITFALGRRTIADLLDEVGPELRGDLTSAVHVAGVVAVRRLRVRRSGPETFADVTLLVARGTGLERAHEIAGAAEAAVRALLPGADVVVHVEPDGMDGRPEDLVATVRRVAASVGVSAHDVRVHDVLGAASVEVHLEMDGTLSVDEAHRQASEFEATLRALAPGLARVVSHLEPLPGALPASPATPEEAARIVAMIRELTGEPTLACEPHDIVVQRTGVDLAISFHCVVPGDRQVSEAHTLTERVERALRERIGGVGNVTIHVEPRSSRPGSG